MGGLADAGGGAVGRCTELGLGFEIEIGVVRGRRDALLWDSRIDLTVSEEL